MEILKKLLNVVPGAGGLDVAVLLLRRGTGGPVASLSGGNKYKFIYHPPPSPSRALLGDP